jgi:hypothetical protein
VRSWIKWAVIALLALTLVNDAGRYLKAVYTIDDRTRAMAFEAAKVAKSNPAPDSGWPTAQKMAEEAGVEVIGYAQTQTSATVVGRINLTGTWVIGPVRALLNRQPLSSPFPIEQRATQTP